MFAPAPPASWAATVSARLASGSVNYLLNKHWVFHSRRHHRQEALGYAALFCAQMLLSWALVTALRALPLSLTLIKMLVDTGLFFVSYRIQKRYIFCHREVAQALKNEKLLVKAL